MAKYQKSPSRVISLVLMVVFGFLALVVGYATFKGDAFEIRSKAGTKEILLKQWTFDKAEDWKAADWARQGVDKGTYNMVVDTKTETRERKEVCTGTKKRGNYQCRQRTVVTQLEPRFQHVGVNTVLRYPFNRLKMRLSVQFSPQSKERQRPEETSFSVQYKLDGKSTYEAPIPIKVTANRGMQEVAFEFPKAMSLKKIVDLRFSFDSIKARANSVVSVDAISLVGMAEAQDYETVYGRVTKVTGDGRENSRTMYRLNGYVEGQTNKRLNIYLLQPGWHANDCPPGRACPQIARRVNINFEDFVNKEVVAKGIISNPATGRTENAEDQYIARSMVTLYVNSMELSLPCQPIPEGCSDPSGAVMCKIALQEGYRWCAATSTEKYVAEGCVVGGCSGTICANAGETMPVTHCAVTPVAACYNGQRCERQPTTGQCGWTMNQELAACIESAAGEDYLMLRQGSRRAPAPEGCTYQQVQCIQAPCDPILVCPSPSATQ